MLECWDRKTHNRVAVKIVRNVQKYRDAAMIEVTPLLLPVCCLAGLCLRPPPSSGIEFSLPSSASKPYCQHVVLARCVKASREGLCTHTLQQE